MEEKTAEKAVKTAKKPAKKSMKTRKTTATTPRKPRKDPKITAFFKATVAQMKGLGVYKPEFDPAITDYAILRARHEALLTEFEAGGCKYFEEYTNKAGATNTSKSPLYALIETLEKDIADRGTRLGLDPAGLKKINNKSFQTTEKSKIGDAVKEVMTKLG